MSRPDIKYCCELVRPAGLEPATFCSGDTGLESVWNGFNSLVRPSARFSGLPETSSPHFVGGICGAAPGDQRYGFAGISAPFLMKANDDTDMWLPPILQNDFRAVVG